MGLFNRWSLNVLFFIAFSVYLCGLFTEVNQLNTANIAVKSVEIYNSGNLLEGYQTANDFATSPPLIYWLSNFMYNLFGVHDWSFKLSSFLFSIITLISTYKIGYLLYNKRIGFISALVILSTQASFYANQNITSSAIFTGAVTLSVWQLLAYLYLQRKRNFITAFIAIGCAVLTNGWLGLFLPLFAMFSYLIGRGKYSQLINPKWFLGLGITALVTAPILFTFNNGFSFDIPIGDFRDNLSNLVSSRFFSSTNPNGAFYLIEFVFAFMPWALVSIWAIGWRVSNAFRDFILKRKKQEWLTLGGFFFPFLVFLIFPNRAYQNLYVAFPFAAIISTEFILRTFSQKPNWWKNIVLSILITSGLLAISISLYLLYSIPTTDKFIWISSTIILSISFYFYIHRDLLHKAVLANIFAILLVNWVLNLHVYPTFTNDYAVSKNFLVELKSNAIDIKNVGVGTKSINSSIQFYAKNNFKPVDFTNSTLINSSYDYYLVNDDELSIVKTSKEVKVLKTFMSYPSRQLTLDFFNPNKRVNALVSYYLIATNKHI